MTDTAQAQGLGPSPGMPASPRAARVRDGRRPRRLGDPRSPPRSAPSRPRAPVCNLTVGDFDPRQFPIPAALAGAIGRARARRDELPAVRRRAGAARGGAPLLRARARASTTRSSRPDRRRRAAGHLRRSTARSSTRATAWSTRCRAGTTTTTSTWSAPWACRSPCGPEDRFLPTARSAARGAPGARLLCLNSPLNPTGTAIDRGRAGAASARRSLEENARARARGRAAALPDVRPDLLDALLRRAREHVTPPGLRARDGALHDLRRRHQQGLRRHRPARGLGGRAGRRDRAHEAILGPRGRLGAAPRAGRDGRAARRRRRPSRAFQATLQARHRGGGSTACTPGLQRCAAAGLPVDGIPPMGAIYLTRAVDPFGRRTPRRRAARDQRGHPALPARGGAASASCRSRRSACADDDGWFRLSVGAVTEADIDAALPRLEGALAALA